MIDGGRENNGFYIMKKSSHGLFSLQWMKIMSCYGVDVSNMNQFKVLGVMFRILIVALGSLLRVLGMFIQLILMKSTCPFDFIHYGKYI